MKWNVVQRVASSDDGATAIEYGLMAAIIGVALALLLPALFGGVDGLYSPVITFFSQTFAI